jgi:hypothetical protein
LNANAPTVNNPQGCESEPVRFFKVGFHRATYIARLEAMEIKHVGDGKHHWFMVVKRMRIATSGGFGHDPF